MGHTMNINANQAISILESISSINYRIEEIQSDINTLDPLNDSYIIEHLQSLINEFNEAKTALIQEINACLNVEFNSSIHNIDFIIEDLLPISKNQLMMDDYQYTDNLESVYSEPDYLDNINQLNEELISEFYKKYF